MLTLCFMHGGEKQGSADKEHVLSAKQLTLINKGKNTTVEAKAPKVNGLGENLFLPPGDYCNYRF